MCCFANGPLCYDTLVPHCFFARFDIDHPSQRCLAILSGNDESDLLEGRRGCMAAADALSHGIPHDQRSVRTGLPVQACSRRLSAQQMDLQLHS